MTLGQRRPTDCGASLWVIMKPRERGGHSPRWTAEPEKINNKYPPMKMERTECQETLTCEVQTPVNCPEEQHSEQGESLKSRVIKMLLPQKHKYSVIRQQSWLCRGN
jgi:hypothetical protein